MDKNIFLGKVTFWTLGLIALFHLLAIIFRGSEIEAAILLLICISIFFVSLYKLPSALLIAFTELFVGGHGHLLSANFFGFTLTLRMAIFLAILVGWSFLLLRKRINLKFKKERDIFWLILAIAILVGGIIGFTTNDPVKVFDDINSFFIILYLLPLISINWNEKRKEYLLQVLVGSAIWLAIFSLALSFIFTHGNAEQLISVYTFVRDSRLAEVTLMTVTDSDGIVHSEIGRILLGGDGYWYRIFMQTHFFIIVVLFILLAKFFFFERNSKESFMSLMVMSVLIAALTLSQSRSFYLAIACAGICFIYFLFRKRSFVQITKKIIGFLPALLLGFVLAWWSIIIPIFPESNLQEAFFYKESSDITRDVAVSARWKLLDPLMDDIFASPIFGSGFGEEVTYQTDDPRIIEETGGEYTTYRFEWGFHDIWLKMGALGILAFVFYFVFLSKVVYLSKDDNKFWLILGLYSGVIVLYVTNIFSPYLNHPIGLGYLLLVIFIDDLSSKTSPLV